MKKRVFLINLFIYFYYQEKRRILEEENLSIRQTLQDPELSSLELDEVRIYLFYLFMSNITVLLKNALFENALKKWFVGSFYAPLHILVAKNYSMPNL